MKSVTLPKLHNIISDLESNLSFIMYSHFLAKDVVLKAYTWSIELNLLPRSLLLAVLLHLCYSILKNMRHRYAKVHRAKLSSVLSIWFIKCSIYWVCHCFVFIKNNDEPPAFSLKGRPVTFIHVIVKLCELWQVVKQCSRVAGCVQCKRVWKNMQQQFLLLFFIVK